MKCTQTTKAGKPCKGNALPGRKTCKQHSGDPDVGQKSKLTEAVHNTIVLALASGCYRATAAEHAGIHVATFYRWLETGEADIEHGVQSPHRELCEAIKKAEADAEVQAVALIRKAAPKQWQAAAWLLERKKPDQWGRRVEHSGKIDTGAEHGQNIARIIAAVCADLGLDVTDEAVRERVRERLSAAADQAAE